MMERANLPQSEPLKQIRTLVQRHSRSFTTATEIPARRKRILSRQCTHRCFASYCKVRSA